MQFLTDVLVAILGAYLALTGALADGIMTVLPVTTEERTSYNALQPEASHTEIESVLSVLSSAYKSSESLPDILVQNASYQSAQIMSGVEATTKSPWTVEDALVNIYCTYTTDTHKRTTTGSGFFIDKAGVILTNAHVAQFLLLEAVSTTGTTECIIRNGNPAEPRYEAELLYISPAWIQKHAHLIDSEQPRGTGERDYALLFVTKGLDNAPMPGQFPYLDVDTSLLHNTLIGDPILVGGYPAGDTLGGALYLDTATTTITDMFTFVSNYADVISIGNSAVGEHGVSGGPVLNAEGNVIGLVTTKGSEEEGTHTLRALTLSYIDRTIIEESTFTLKETISGQLAFRAELFTSTIAPFLSRILESELE